MQFTRFAAGACAVLAIAPAAAADRVDQFIQREMARTHIPAAAVAVVRDGKIVKIAAYGTADLEAGARANLQSPFQIASTTKLMTSALLMQLVGEGKIDLDVPVARYIEGAPAEWDTMTVRHLVSHTSGLPRVAVPPDLATPADAVELAKKQKLAARPGEVAAYGSLDFSLVAYIIEKAAGQPLEALLAERIWQPAGMTATRFARYEFSPNKEILRTELVPNRVTTYQWTADGRQLGYRYLYPAYTFAAGGAFTSIHDIAAFLQGIDSGKLVSPALAARMFEPAQLNSGKPAGFAVGWTQATFRGRREVGHSGGPALADVRYYPDQKLGVAVLTNQRNLMPVLARGVAATYLPPAAYLKEQGVADNDPGRTATVKRLLEQFTIGRADPALFGGDMKAALKELNTLLPLQLGALAPMSRLVLLDAAPDNSVRTYRAIHGKDASLRWVVRFDQDGRVTDLDTVDE